MTDRGTLYIVSTPIGNMQDLTLRAMEILNNVDLIVCEDTRVTLKLLTRHQIKKPLQSFHARSRQSSAERIVRSLKNGYCCAYVTDSGTPSISDPGSILVWRAVEEGCPVVPVPGPSAACTALSASGIPCSEYIFLGFISNKESRRRKKLAELNERRSVLVFYESPHRLLKFLHDVLDIMGNVQCCVAKEMTKKFEKYYRGGIVEVIDAVSSDGVRGEYTVIVDNRADPAG